MKKKIFYSLILLGTFFMMMLGLVGCEKAETADAAANRPNTLPSNFEVIAEEISNSYSWSGTVMDKDTKVVYYYSYYAEGFSTEETLVPLYNADGSLKTIEGD